MSAAGGGGDRVARRIRRLGRGRLSLGHGQHQQHHLQQNAAVVVFGAGGGLRAGHGLLVRGDVPGGAGVGIWGINVPVAWGFAIVNFVWWIGIGHAGTLISAILLLLRQEWRTSINRFAEAMTLFAVACAGMFPLLHLGRIWKFYYLLPYPNTMGLYPQWRSPLIWDVFAVSTYATVSFLFWYVGLIPDLGTMRDRAHNRAGRLIYGLLAMGWRGSARHWRRYDSTYMILAALATPLVISVHSVVGMDFAASQLPGWHTTFFPPTLWPGRFTRGLRWCLRSRSRCAGSTSCTTISR